MAYLFEGDNPSQLYMDTLLTIMREGDTVSPRGLEVKEIRPTIITHKQPLNRAIFLEGRKTNPFFLLAEALWILLGRSDVKWLEYYNSNMKNFSDDGVDFNAPYGERLRNWGMNSASGYIYNPIDQLVDVYNKLKEDPDTRQAVATIYNPLFDNHTVKTVDRPCNVLVTFKIRKGKLDLTVVTRGNDVTWGVWTNHVQFSTIQEMVASWLGIEVGELHQISDSLHNYTKDYGWKETEKIFSKYGVDSTTEVAPTVNHFFFENEPRMLKTEPAEFDNVLAHAEQLVETLLHDNPDFILNNEIVTNTMNVITQCPDPYIRLTLYAMVAYRAHRLGNKEAVFTALESMTDCQWKLSCIYFLYNKYKEEDEFLELFEHYSDDMKDYITNQ